MDKSLVLKRILDCGVVAVVRADSPEQALKIAEQCARAGVAALEITFTVPGAADVIKELAKVYTDGKIIVGAGTVLDAETARTAILAGAQYIVSPCLNEGTIKMCNRYQVASMAGAMTVKEVVECMECGADVVKLFPGDLFGPAFIKAIKGPLPYAKIMPTGGVDLNNTADWIRAGAVAVGIGGNLTKGAKTGDYESIYDLGIKYIEAVKKGRGNV